MDQIPDAFIMRQAVRAEVAIANAEPIYPMEHERTKLPRLLPLEAKQTEAKKGKKRLEEVLSKGKK